MGRIIIRKFRGEDLEIQSYIDSVLRVLAIIRRNLTGRILLGHIRLTNYNVLINPFWGPTPNASANCLTCRNSGTTDVVHNCLTSFGSTFTTKPILAPYF